MHYQNGREAKAGDRIIDLKSKRTGMVYDLNAKSETCNGRLGNPNPSDPWVTLSECLHIDDAEVSVKES